MVLTSKQGAIGMQVLMDIDHLIRRAACACVCVTNPVGDIEEILPVRPCPM